MVKLVSPSPSHSSPRVMLPASTDVAESQRIIPHDGRKARGGEAAIRAARATGAQLLAELRGARSRGEAGLQVMSVRENRVAS